MPDLRTPLDPPIGPSITEPGIAERWRSYDRSYRAEARISRFWVADIHEATVYPPYGVVGQGDRLVRDTIRNGNMLANLFPDADPAELRQAMASPEVEITGLAEEPQRYLPGHSFLLGFGVFANYFNWTLRYASRVALFQMMPPSCRLVVPAPIKQYIRETLEFMGVPEERVVYLDVPTAFERLTLAAPTALGRYEISPLITETLREHPRVTDLPRAGRRRLYIPRRNVRMRRVVNEAAVEDALAMLGFEVFDNAEYSVRDQAHAFRDAEIVIAPHGAGLSNIVYCDAGTPVIEIVPEGYDQGATSYRSLADLFGLSYVQLFAREAAPDRKGNRCNADIELDVEELVHAARAQLV
ncbi:glycosyltransferase family 61 protein [Sediminicoccus rosea]|uniref:Glycosyltransferase family 61 protein n=1 Tax=Sediminicoccus rosea TaxID=1225128 RepID=A0ABZ0PFK8_9PROT|nr:glycosyltransferase family 61 protein [Sediminicoccus rosea]WPB84251.1 glycosyltransferase family 61 protein [Sediminicoccus rosea]